jgi:hypothetical protein
MEKMKLPTFKGWTIDTRLGEFRKVAYDKDHNPCMETISFRYSEGIQLLNEYEEDMNNPIKRLRCACCGEDTFGRQWHNRDTGYGLCWACADSIAKKEKPEYMKQCYGIEGVHYKVGGVGNEHKI